MFIKVIHVYRSSRHLKWFCHLLLWIAPDLLSCRLASHLGIFCHQASWRYLAHFSSQLRSSPCTSGRQNKTFGLGHSFDSKRIPQYISCLHSNYSRPVHEIDCSSNFLYNMIYQQISTHQNRCVLLHRIVLRKRIRFLVSKFPGHEVCLLSRIHHTPLH